MPPTAQDRLHDILESILQIEQMIQGKSVEQFASEIMLRLATERLLEIICEASRKLPDQVKRIDSAIDWRKMTDFGNVLRHAYHAIKVDIVWDIVQGDLPALKSFVLRNLEHS